MEYMHELKEMLCDELEKIADKGELTAGSLDTVDKLTHSIKSIATIMAMEDSDYSYENGGGNMGGGSNRGSYRGGSYAQRRDSRGRYARQSRQSRRSNGGSYRRGSRADETEMIVEKLEMMMDKVEDQTAKQALEDAIEAMEM